MKQGVAAQLEKHSKFDPGFTFAVVFDYTPWHPVQPPAGSEWDYDPFITREMAGEFMADPPPGVSEMELWRRTDHGWEEETS
jgi:hypothetical protein